LPNKNSNKNQFILDSDSHYKDSFYYDLENGVSAQHYRNQDRIIEP